MTIYDHQKIDAIMTTPGIGAGNFLYSLSKHETDKNRKVLILDIPVNLPDGRQVLELTLADILLWSNTNAAWFKLQGITCKDPVGLYLDDTIDYLINYLALTQIGAIPVMINGNLTVDIAARFLERVGAVMAISTKEKWLSLEPVLKVLNSDINKKNISDIDSSSGKCEEYYQHQASDPVLLGHTSGTTGIPKAVQFNHHGFFFGIKQQINKQMGTRILSALPHSHASAISIIMSSVLRGALIKIQSKKSPTDIFSTFETFKPDMFVSFPKIYVDICRYDLNQQDLSSISYWLSTGDANHESHIKKLIEQGSYTHKGKRHKGSVFIDNLGSSEFGFAAFRNMHYPGSNKYDRRIGLPFDWVEAAVLDDDGNKLDAHKVGYLGVKSESVTAGYWNNTLLSEKNRLAGFWLTGDLVYKNKDGVYFHVDRTTDSIKTKDGFLYSCQTEELILRNFSHLFDCSIVGVKSEAGYQKPILTVETNNGEKDDKLLEEINLVLEKNNTPLISSIIFESSSNDTGVTGKKLKRVVRDKFVAAQ